jgi:two-component system cell cycle response regulator DivK
MEIRDWKILVVEDEDDSRILIEALLKHHGAFTIGVASAENALNVLETNHPTLIIVDLALPQMDGWGLLKCLNTDAKLKDIPRVAVTAFHTPVLPSKALSAGFDAFFAKPIDATTFVQELQTIIQDRLAG